MNTDLQQKVQLTQFRIDLAITNRFNTNLIYNKKPNQEEEEAIRERINQDHTDYYFAQNFVLETIPDFEDKLREALQECLKNGFQVDSLNEYHNNIIEFYLDDHLKYFINYDFDFANIEFGYSLTSALATVEEYMRIMEIHLPKRK